MNKIIVITGIAGIIAAGIVGVGTINASALTSTKARQMNAQGNGYQSSLESRAEVLGLSVEALQKALETKTMSEIAVEQGITEDVFHAKMTEAAKSRWAANGLTTEEIAERTAEREARQAENSVDHEFGSGEGSGQSGYGRNHK